MLGYDAVGLAIKDFSSGGQYLLDMAQKYKVPFVSTNVFYVDSKKPFVETTLNKRLTARSSSVKPPFEKLAIGILALCDEKESLFHQNLQEPQLSSREPVEAAKKAVAELHSADLIVLLYNGRYATLENLLIQVPNIDIVVVGGEYYKVMPNSTRKPVIVSTPSLGKYFGMLTLTLNDRKKIIGHRVERFELEDTIQDDPRFLRLVADFDNVQRTAPQHSQ